MLTKEVQTGLNSLNDMWIYNTIFFKLKVLD